MAAYYTNNDYMSPQRTPYDYTYSRATMTSSLLDTIDKLKPSTLSTDIISGQACEKMLTDT
jgi:hypothetical protein